MGTNILNPHRGQIYLKKPFSRGGDHYLAKIAIYLPGMILLSLIFIVPAAYQGIKAILLIVIISEIWLNTLMAGRFHMNPTIFLLFMFYLMLGLLYGFYGFYRGNLGALPVTKEIVFYVLIYMFLITGVRNYFCMKLIHNTIILATIIICLYVIDTTLYSLGLIPDWLYVNLYENTTGTQSVGLSVLSIRGTIDIDMSSLPSFLFLQPYLITYTITDTKQLSKFSLLLIFVATFIMLMSGKRILLLCGLFSPLIISVFLWFISSGNKLLLRRIKAIFLILVLFNLIFFIVLHNVGYDFRLMAKYLIDGFESCGNTGSNIRVDQFYALLDGWIQNPIFGVGSGAVLWEYLRSSESPWNYELSYMKLLYDFGLIGVMLYGIGLLFTWLKSTRIYLGHCVLGKYALATVIGSIAFIVGNATNPYLLKFDYLVVIFLPIAIINLWLVNRRRGFIDEEKCLHNYS